MDLAGRIVGAQRRRNFEVICAGEPLWRAAREPHGYASAGLLNIARMLAFTRLHVGLSTALDDDRLGRTSLAELAALGIDVGGVRRASTVTDLVVVDAAGGQSSVIAERGVAPDLEIPPSWSSQVLLLSGLSPVTSRLAAFCKAARSARREGAVVVLDVVGSMRHWAGRDARVIAMVLREADVVHGSLFDLAVIGADSAIVRQAMRPQAALVVHDGDGVTATGAFGDVRVPMPRGAITAEAFAEGCTAAICAEHARPQRLAESPSGRWHRILRQGAPELAAYRLMQRPARVV
jgi:sugar/nucleoside kinase (ribokinase family)